MRNTFKDRISRFLQGWLGILIIAILLSSSFKSAVADWNVVPTGSMKPTIVEGDRIFVNKLAYDLKIPYTTVHLSTWGHPERGDIVVFFSPADHTRMVKRVVGLPGDKIAVDRHQLSVNGRLMKYKPLQTTAIRDTAPASNPYAHLLIENLDGRKHPVAVSRYRSTLDSFGPVPVPKGHYFMMGDNRHNSADSRYFGPVQRRPIVSRASAVVISLDSKWYYRPRAERWVTKLP